MSIQDKSEIQHPKKKEYEMVYYGLHICETIYKVRPEDIIKVFVTNETSRKVPKLLSYCAQNKKAYKIIEAAELEKITGSVHHEGIGMITKKAKKIGTLEKLTAEIAKAPSPIIYIDGVSNPHNVATVLRIMANFGFKYLIGAHDMTELSASAARMSEGGAEFVTLYKSDSIHSLVEWARTNNYTLIGTSSYSNKSLYKYKFPKKSIIVLGHEVTGMSKETEKAMNEMLVIPGTGLVESLNVSTAASIIMGEYFRTVN